jgi:hypothetical protein
VSNQQLPLPAKYQPRTHRPLEGPTTTNMVPSRSSGKWEHTVELPESPHIRQTSGMQLRTPCSVGFTSSCYQTLSPVTQAHYSNAKGHGVQARLVSQYQPSLTVTAVQQSRVRAARRRGERSLPFALCPRRAETVARSTQLQRQAKLDLRTRHHTWGVDAL